MKKIISMLMSLLSFIGWQPKKSRRVRLIPDLQFFADAGSLINGTGAYSNAYTGDTTPFVPGTSDLSSLDKTYYDTAVLDNAYDKLIYTQLGLKQTLPAKHGRTIEWRRWQTLGTVHRLQEGVIPTGRKLSQVAITATLSQWGDYVAISDLLDVHSIDEPKTKAAELLGAAGGLTNDLLTRNVLLGGTNIIFAPATNKSTGAEVSTPTTEAELQTALATYDCNLTGRAIAKAVTNLKKGAKQLKYSGNYYVAVIHPDVAEDLRHDKDWLDAHVYASPEEIFSGEIGRLHGVRFVECNNAPVIKGENDTYATFKTMFFAKDAFGVVDPEGGSMETIIKSKGEIGGPLEQFGTVGVKFEMAARILYQERMVTVWHGSSYSDVEEDNIDVPETLSA